MTSFCENLLRSSRLFVSVVVAGVLTTVFLVADVGTARADEQATPVVGSFTVGGNVTAGVDARTGALTTQVPLVELPGISGSGGVSVGLSYSQDLAAADGDPHGVGAGWSWGVARVEVDGGVRVVTPSGGVYTASQEASSDDGKVSSGLERYVQGDVVFSQTDNTSLDPRDGVSERTPYAYVLEHLGGVKEFFSSSGHIVARIDAFDYRTDL